MSAASDMCADNVVAHGLLPLICSALHGEFPEFYSEIRWATECLLLVMLASEGKHVQAVQIDDSIATSTQKWNIYENYPEKLL